MTALPVLRLPAGWDGGVLALNGHVLQSSAWGRVQARLGNRVLVDADRDWCWLGVVRSAGPFRYLYLPFGPSVRGPGDLAAALESARGRARRAGCVFVRFEPGAAAAGAVAELGARRVRPRQYEHTLVMALDGDEETLRRGLNKGHRSRVNSSGRRGIRVERSSDPRRMEAFVRMLRATEQRAGFFSYEDPYFTAIAEELLPHGDAALYLAMIGDVPAAGALVFDFGPTRYYAFGATDTSSRKLMPAVPLVWQTILDAQADGRRRYDFWGAAPPGAGPDHPWAGITEFKRGFGGTPASFAGTWELDVRRFAARLFTVAHRVGRMRSRAAG